METTLETSTTTSIENPSIKEVLKNSPFMVLFTAQFIENIGRAVSGLAIEFLIYELTGSPLLMGILSIVWLSPFVIIAPIAGVLADRFDQRTLMLFSNIISFLASVGFVIIYLLRSLLVVETIIQVPFSSGIISEVHIMNYVHVLWPLYVLCFINSAAAAFFFPARSSYTRLIVKKKNLLVANSVGSTVFQIATIVGFLCAGILAERSYLASFIFDASTFLVSGILIVVLFFIGQKPPQASVRESEAFAKEMKKFGNDIAVGYRTIREYPKISYMLIIFSLITFTFGAINVLFIVILQGEMGLGQTWYGIMQAIMGGSGIIAAITLMSIGKIKRKILLLNIAFSLGTVAMFLFGILRNTWAMAAIMFSFGIIIVLINVPSSTLIQETVPYEKQGRVFGAQQLVQGIAQLVGMGLVSIIAEYVFPMYIIVASSGLLLIVIVIGFIVSKRRNLMSNDYEETEENGPKKTLEKTESPEITEIAIASYNNPDKKTSAE